MFCTAKLKPREGNYRGFKYIRLARGVLRLRFCLILARRGITKWARQRWSDRESSFLARKVWLIQHRCSMKVNMNPYIFAVLSHVGSTANMLNFPWAYQFAGCSALGKHKVLASALSLGSQIRKAEACGRARTSLVAVRCPNRLWQ